MQMVNSICLSLMLAHEFRKIFTSCTNPRFSIRICVSRRFLAQQLDQITSRLQCAMVAPLYASANANILPTKSQPTHQKWTFVLHRACVQI